LSSTFTCEQPYKFYPAAPHPNCLRIRFSATSGVWLVRLGRTPLDDGPRSVGAHHVVARTGAYACAVGALDERGHVRSQRRTVRPTKKPKASMSVALVLPRMITVTSASR